MQPPYTFQSLRAASRKEVVDELNRQLALVEKADQLDKPHHALRAQLLIQELAGRNQNRQACIMILCTIAITAMTALLVYLTWRILPLSQ
jgi:hypothetical protein